MYWCDDYLGIHLDTHAGTWNGNRLRPFEAVRADVHERVVAQLRTMREALAEIATMTPYHNFSAAISVARSALAALPPEAEKEKA